MFERTDGIPLHIEELLGAMSAEARADGTAIREATVPDTIEDAVIARISHRSPEAQATARAGAVIGRCFVPEVLAGIMDLPLDALEAPLQELVDHGVLEPPGLRGLYDFRHQLLRDALYRTIPAQERRRFHARAGEFCTQLEGASEIHASVHYERAGLRQQAFAAALVGAREAARISAHREAFELYRRAVDNMADDLDQAERAPLLQAYALEALSIEENEIAERFAHEADVAYRALGQPARAIFSLATVFSVWRRQGRPLSECLTVMHELWTELEGLPEDPDVLNARADVAFGLAITLTSARDLPAARAFLEATRALGDRLGDLDWRMAADWKAEVVDVVAGDARAGVARIGDIALAAERSGFESTGVSAFRDAGTLAAASLDYRTAATWIDHGLRYADSIEQSFCAHVMSATSAMVSWAGADWVEASVRARQAVVDKGCHRAASMARWALGYVALGRGDLGTATVELAEALRFGETTEDIDLIMPPLWGLAEVAVLEAGSGPRVRPVPGCARPRTNCRRVDAHDAVRGHRCAGGATGRSAQRGSGVAGGLHRASRVDPRYRRRGAGSRPRTGRPRRRIDRHRTAGAGGRRGWLG